MLPCIAADIGQLKSAPPVILHNAHDDTYDYLNVYLIFRQWISVLAFESVQ